MKKCLVICPSRGRVNKANDFINSFIDTHVCSDLVLCVDECDPELYYYKKLGVNLLIWKRKSVTEIINNAFRLNPDYEFYNVTNDDIAYKTKGFDEKLCNKGKISCGFEPNLQKKQGKVFPKKCGDSYVWIKTDGFPQISFIDGDIIRKLGWLQNPCLERCCGDNVWYQLGKRTKRLYYDPTAVYEHNHWYFGLSDNDESYKEEFDDNMKLIREDYQKYKLWIGRDMGKDAEKMAGV